MNSKITSCKALLQSAIVYYYEALKEDGINDVSQAIATDIVQMINLTDEQKKYVLEESRLNTIEKSLKDLGIIVSTIEHNKTVSQSAVKTMKEYIKFISTTLKA